MSYAASKLSESSSESENENVLSRKKKPTEEAMREEAWGRTLRQLRGQKCNSKSCKAAVPGECLQRILDSERYNELDWFWGIVDDSAVCPTTNQRNDCQTTNQRKEKIALLLAKTSRLFDEKSGDLTLLFPVGEVAAEVRRRGRLDLSIASSISTTSSTSGVTG